MAKKQYIWLIRYGKTEYPLKEHDGPYNSDIDPIVGKNHAQCIADHISNFLSKQTFEIQIYSSPFLRCVHTASIIGSKLKTKVWIEDGLYEWLVPSLLIERKTNQRTYPNTLEESNALFPDLIKLESSLNPYKIDESNDYFSFPETDELKLLSRCQDTLTLILKDDRCKCRCRCGVDSEKDEHIIIVAHAPCVQALAFAMEEDVDDVKDSKLTKWPLGGITRFSRDILHGSQSYGKWNMDFYGMTDHMPGEYKNGIGLWSLSSFDK